VKESLRQVRTGLVVIYSLVVMVTIVLGIGQISGVILVPYYVFIPGYCIALLLREVNTITEGLFYSIAWSLAAVATVYSFGTLGYGFLPITLVIPTLTVLVVAYDHLHAR
jgi:hypothetical protein